MNTDNFWTDELVAECHDYINSDTAGVLTPYGVMQNIQYFKQSKQPPIGSKDKKIRATNVSFESNSNLIKVFINGNVSDVVGRLSVDKILDNMTNALNDDLPTPSPKEEDKRIEVNRVWQNEDLTNDYKDGWYAYQFSINTSIHPQRFDAIKHAIEASLNEEDVRIDFIYLHNKYNPEHKVYRQSEVDAMMEKVFEAARERDFTKKPVGEYYNITDGQPDISKCYPYKFTFKEYLQSLPEPKPAPSLQEEKKEVIPVSIDENAYKNRCNVCGDNLVYIRGKYPNTDKRYTCPTCTTERLEQINEISNKDYGKAYTSNHHPIP